MLIFYEAQELFNYLNTILSFIAIFDRFQGNYTSCMVAQYVKHRQCLELISSSEEIIFHLRLIRPFFPIQLCELMREQVSNHITNYGPAWELTLPLTKKKRSIESHHELYIVPDL